MMSMNFSEGLEELINETRDAEESPERLNISCLDHAPTPTSVTIAQAIFLMIMAVITITSNVGMLLSLQRRKKRFHCLHQLLSHLALADILVAAFCILGDALWRYTVQWVLGNVGCKMFKFSQMVSLYLSTFIMVLIAMDHFMSVRYPLRARSRGGCQRSVGYCWVLSIILSLPQAVIFNLEQGPFREPFLQCVTHSFYTAVWQEQLYTTLSSVFMFVIPLVILVSTYIMTLWTLHCNEKTVEGKPNAIVLTDQGRQARIRGAKRKSLVISVTITVTFLTCWTPYYVLLIVSIFVQKTAMEELSSQSFFFGMSTSLFNPLIYGLFHLYLPKRNNMQEGYAGSVRSRHADMEISFRASQNKTS